MANKEIKETVADRFSKESLSGATIFKNRKDALAVVIKDGEELTIEEAQARLDEFMKGKVK